MLNELLNRVIAVRDGLASGSLVRDVLITRGDDILEQQLIQLLEGKDSGGIEPIILRYKVQLQEENSPIITPDASNPQFSEIEEAFEANKPFFVIQQTITTDGATINASGFVVPQYDDMGGEYKFPSLYKGVDISF